VFASSVGKLNYLNQNCTRIKNKIDLNKIRGRRMRMRMRKIFSSSSILFQFLETSDSRFEGDRARLCDLGLSNLFLFLFFVVQRFYFCSDRIAFTFCSFSFRATLDRIIHSSFIF